MWMNVISLAGMRRCTIKRVAFSEIRAHDGNHPVRAAEPSIASKKYHQVGLNCFCGHEITADVLATVVVFDQLHVWQERKSLTRFIVSLSAVANDYSIMRHAGRIAAITVQKTGGFDAMFTFTVKRVDIDDYDFHSSEFLVE
jgi:hypothetical protein